MNPFGHRGGEPLTMDEFVMVNELYGLGVDPEDPHVIERLAEYNRHKLATDAETVDDGVV